MFAQRKNPAQALCLTVLGWACCVSFLAAQQPGHTPDLPVKQSRTIPIKVATFSGLAAPDNSLATPQMVAWLETLIRRNLPPIYEDDRKWGKQKEVWAGVKLRREGLRIETKRKKKMVNAGTWTRYSISIVEPEQRLFIQFHRLEVLPGGRIAFGVTADCTLDVFGRLSQWVRNVQLISMSANADVACRLTLEGTVEFRVDPFKFPPDIALKPHVDRAHIDITYYRVRRISQIGGDFAKHLGKGLRNVVDEKLEDMNGKLATKINKQLEKHSEKLSFSAQDWLQSKFRRPTVEQP